MAIALSAWRRDPELNWGHPDFQSGALPVELSRHPLLHLQFRYVGVCCKLYQLSYPGTRASSSVLLPDHRVRAAPGLWQPAPPLFPRRPSCDTIAAGRDGSLLEDGGARLRIEQSRGPLA